MVHVLQNVENMQEKIRGILMCNTLFRWTDLYQNIAVNSSL